MQMIFLKTHEPLEALLGFGIGNASLSESQALANAIDPGFDLNLLTDLAGIQKLHVKFGRDVRALLAVEAIERSCRCDVHIRGQRASMSHVESVLSEFRGAKGEEG